jgi:hypothetical protein
MKLFSLLCFLIPTWAIAGYGGMGGVSEGGGAAEVSALAIPAVVVSVAVLHFFGDRALLKMWGAFLVIALVIGLLKGLQ